MKKCSLKDFMEELKPWLDGDYIREALVNPEGNVVLRFQDGVQNVYRIDDCDRGQVAQVLRDLESRGVKVL